MSSKNYSAKIFLGDFLHHVVLIIKMHVAMGQLGAILFKTQLFKQLHENVIFERDKFFSYSLTKYKHKMSYDFFR
jgi:hypothetical protein